MAGYRRDIREDEDGRDASLMIPYVCGIIGLDWEQKD